MKHGWKNALLKDDVLLAGYNTVPGPCIGSIDVNAPLLSPSLSAVGADSKRASDSWHHQRGTKHRLSRYAAHMREHSVLWDTSLVRSLLMNRVRSTRQSWK